jgi:hypothetical protein
MMMNIRGLKVDDGTTSTTSLRTMSFNLPQNFTMEDGSIYGHHDRESQREVDL